MNINKLTKIISDYEFLDENEEYNNNHKEYEEDTIIIYSYKNDQMVETRKQLNNFNIKFDEYEDDFGESYLLIEPTKNKLTNY